jgi:hypothetical protein
VDRLAPVEPVDAAPLHAHDVLPRRRVQEAGAALFAEVAGSGSVCGYKRGGGRVGGERTSKAYALKPWVSFTCYTLHQPTSCQLLCPHKNSRITAQQLRLRELEARKDGGRAERGARLPPTLETVADVEGQRLLQWSLERHGAALASGFHLVLCVGDATTSCCVGLG